MAAVVVCALGAGSASALEWKACVKAEPKGSGTFGDKGCTSAGTKYKLASAAGVAFTGKGKKPVNQLVNPVTHKVENFFEAKKDSTVGEVTGPSSTTFTETFTGVKLHEPEAPCQSSGQASGTIVTNKLGTMLVPISAGSGQGQLIFAAAGPTEPLAAYECAGVSIKVVGAIIAELTGLSGPANKKWGLHVQSRGGTVGNLQEFLYLGGAGTEAEEEEAQDYFEYVVCLKEGNPKAVCEGAVGDGKEPAKPFTLLSEAGPPISKTAPAAQNGTNANKNKKPLKIV